jgi:hypothetical protein
MGVSFLEAYSAAKHPYDDETWWRLRSSQRAALIYHAMRDLDAARTVVMPDARWDNPVAGKVRTKGKSRKIPSLE